MGDWTNKGRPPAERIARLQGRSTFCDPKQYGVTGMPDLTDQDVAAALAMIRKKPKLLSDAPDIGPELLETYYGSTDKHRPMLRAEYLRTLKKDHREMVVHRMAATLAVQIVAGMKYSRAQEIEYAYICHIRRESLMQAVDDAARWFWSVIDETLPAFNAVIRLAEGIRHKSRSEQAKAA